MLKVAGVKFRDWSKIYTFDTQGLELKKEDKVIVETEGGLCFGAVRMAPYEPEHGASRKDIKKIIRIATEEDLMQLARNEEKERDAFNICRETIEKMGLTMKLVNVEYMFDGSKALFYFTAEERVDFRELVKNLAGQVHTRIEMRQIGVRDEAKKKGGIGPCGRMLCCTTWINSFGPVSVKMAKVQGLSLNPANISGMCGRLMCCLAFEHKNYIDGVMPKKASPPPPAPQPAGRDDSRGRKSEDRRPGNRPKRQERPAPAQKGEEGTKKVAGKGEKEGERDAKKPRPRRRKKKKWSKKEQ